MSTHKHIDKICVVAVVLCLILSLLFWNGGALGLQPTNSTMGYETRLFDTDQVHTIDIVIDDWDTFLSTAQSEEYSVCSVVIDGDAITNVGIRGKGNTSLSSVASMDSDRYSFKIEFDQYDSTKSYYGLDKLCLNNIIQDNTYMKDYLVYQMMAQFGVNAPLCSYAYITVNGEDWGLYLAVEGVEDSFLQRNYGSNYGDLYKPDSMSFGGGRGNGKDFSMSNFMDQSDNTEDTTQQSGTSTQHAARPSDKNSDRLGNKSLALDEQTIRSAFEKLGLDQSLLDNVNFENVTADALHSVLSQLDSETMQEIMKTVMGQGVSKEMDNKNSFGGMGSSDVKLQYIDDDPESYSNIFDSAKTSVTETDQQRLIASLKQLSEYENLESVVNVEDVLRYFVVHNYVVNGDSYTGSMIHNYYLYEEDGQLSMIPWDYNLSFGTFQSQNASAAVNDDIDEVLSDRPMQAWIFSDETYTQQYYELYTQLLEQVDIQSIIDHAAALIAPYVEKDPTAFCTYDEFQSGVSALKEFCVLRTESVLRQLSGNTEAVDAGDLDLSDLGTMNHGMGGDRQNTQPGFPNRNEGSSDSLASEGTFPSMPQGGMMTSPDGVEMPNMGSMEKPDMGSMEMPTMSNTEMPSMNGGNRPADAVPGQSAMDSAFPQAAPTHQPGEHTAGTSTAILLGSSVLLLLVGLFIALKYKR